MKIFFPWKNLGCLGIRIGGFYADMFRNPYWGIFVNTGRQKLWFRLAG